MKSLKAIQKIDELGRVIIPLEMRQILEWNQRDKLFLSLNAEENTISINMADKFMGPECLFCGTKEVKFEFNSPEVCAACLQSLVASGRLTHERLDELKAK